MSLSSFDYISVTVLSITSFSFKYEPSYFLKGKMTPKGKITPYAQIRAENLNLKKYDLLNLRLKKIIGREN